MTTEIHLFILWDKAKVSEKPVLQRIRAEFEILRVFQVHWSPSLFSRNLSRFYGQHLPPRCNKEGDCGTGSFTLVVVRDDRPSYALRNTTRGPTHVNTRTFDIKFFFRSPENGSLPIHATDTRRETFRDLTMLLGVGPARFADLYPGTWNGEILPLHRDIAGAWGWESIGELFSVLNETLDYVVLRNFECLPDKYHMESHGDIDLLVSNYTEACLIANSTPVFREPYRVYQTINIAGEDIPFDFRYIGDNYYDKNWQRRILESRIFTNGCFFIPDAENYFYSLLYHAAVHKPVIDTDYRARLTELANTQDIRLDPDSFFGNSQKVRAFLLRYMNRKGYKFTHPLDSSVNFNTTIGCSRLERLMPHFLPKKIPQHHSQALNNELPENSQPTRGDQHILDSLRRKCRDVSSYSAEVLMLIHDIRSEYLLGPARANLLRPFHFSPQQRVLELGCGGGNITRFLGETGIHIVAIDNAPIHAAIAAERCRDLPNVTVSCKSLAALKADEKFDCAILIDGSEYAQAIIDSSDSTGDFLKRISSYLKEESFFILAINNQLGLKYLNGCGEASTGIPYFGINDLYKEKTPTTLGRRELEARLRAAGFTDVSFFYPFPDHNSPDVILADNALNHQDFQTADLLSRTFSRNYSGGAYRAFYENLAWQPLARNGLIREIANSFLVVASKMQPPNHSQPDWLARVYSTGRLPCFATETVFLPEGDAIVVAKHPLSPGTFPPTQTNTPHFHHQLPPRTAYIIGRLYAAELQPIMARGGGVIEVAQWAAPWVERLAARATHGLENIMVLPGSWLDTIPTNLVKDRSGALVDIDAEWSADAPVPLSWVLIRGIVNALAICPISPAFAGLTFRDAVGKIMNQLGQVLSEEDYRVAALLEDALRNSVYGRHPATRPFGELLTSPIESFTSPVTFHQEIARLHHEMTQLSRANAELQSIYQSTAWRAISPLLKTYWHLRAAWRRSRQ